MERTKMSRENRAKQFAPFDALKGLQDAIHLKEYQHERVQKGDIQEEKANEISKALISLEKGSVAKVVYFENGHNLNLQGAAKLLIDTNELQVGIKKIHIDDLLDIEIIKK